MTDIIIDTYTTRIDCICKGCPQYRCIHTVEYKAGDIVVDDYRTERCVDINDECLNHILKDVVFSNKCHRYMEHLVMGQNLNE